MIDSLKKYRKDKRYSQEEMGDLLGIGVAMYNKIENGKHPGGPKVWKKFSELTSKDLNNTQTGNNNSNVQGNNNTITDASFYFYLV